MSKPTVPQVQPIVDAFYAIDGNGVGGVLHIVLDDGNVHDDHVQFCIDRAETEGDARGAALGRVLLSMSRTQRRKLATCLSYSWESEIGEIAEAEFDRLMAELDAASHSETHS